MKKTAKLIHKNKIILNNMVMASGLFEISRGLMFAGKKRIDKGICLIMPTKSDVRHGAAVTMLFCFRSYDILFINSKFEVVDKKTLKPWTPTYTPQKPCKYVIESTKGKFSNINIKDKVKIEEK